MFRTIYCVSVIPVCVGILGEALVVLNVSRFVIMCPPYIFVISGIMFHFLFIGSLSVTCSWLEAAVRYQYTISFVTIIDFQEDGRSKKLHCIIKCALRV
jgi:hypothetical protein